VTDDIAEIGPPPEAAAYCKSNITERPPVELGLQSSDKESGHHLNDDKSPLIDLLTCIVCKRTMKLEKSAPDAEGRDIIQYRCDPCSRIERVRLFRRSRDSAG
jgi:hypothetical protein